MSTLREAAQAVVEQRDNRGAKLIGLAYGHLWMVNNEPGTPNRYSPERAAYEARKLLRDTMTQEQRGAFINRVIAQCQPPTTEG